MPRETTQPNPIDISKILTMGTFKPEQSLYTGQIVYGFSPEEADCLLAFAHDQAVDPEIFLEMAERTRRMLEYTYPSYPQPKQSWVFFRPVEQEVLPGLKDIEETFYQALSKLFPIFADEFMSQQLDVDPIIRNHGLKDLLTKTQKQLQALNDPRLNQPFLKTAIAFVGFLQGGGIEVLKRPTRDRLFHEVFDPKLK